MSPDDLKKGREDPSLKPSGVFYPRMCHFDPPAGGEKSREKVVNRTGSLGLRLEMTYRLIFRCDSFLSDLLGGKKGK